MSAAFGRVNSAPLNLRGSDEVPLTMEVNVLTRFASINRDLYKATQELTRPPRERHPHAALLFALRRFFKGFGIGFLGKLAINIVPLLARFKFKSLRAHLFQLISDPVGYGVFLGAFISVFESLVRSLRKSTNSTLRRYRAAVAGGVASLALTALPAPVQVTVSIFFFARALEVAVRFLCDNGYLPDVPFADVWLMVFASQEVLNSWIVYPKMLDPSYLRFLNAQGGTDVVVKDNFAKLLSCTSLEECNAIVPTHATTVADALCLARHPDQPSCTLHFISFVKNGLVRALPVYLPVYLVPLVFFRYQSLLNDPVSTLGKVIVNVSRSSMFLASYCAMAWGMTCALTNSGVFQGHAQAVARASGVAGTSLLFEKDHRRIELALYVFTHAIRSMSNRFVSNGWVPRMKRVHLFSFIWSMSVVMAAFVESPELMRPSYAKLLGFMFGSASGRIQSPPQDDPDPELKPKLV